MEITLRSNSRIVILRLLLVLQLYKVSTDAAQTVCEFRGWTASSRDNTFYYQRVELTDALDCLERCVESADICRAAVFIVTKKKVARHYCQFYAINSDTLGREMRVRPNEEAEEETTLLTDVRTTVTLFELRNRCPADAVDMVDRQATARELSTAARLTLLRIGSKATSGEVKTKNAEGIAAGAVEQNKRSTHEKRAEKNSPDEKTINNQFRDDNRRQSSRKSDGEEETYEVPSVESPRRKTLIGYDNADESPSRPVGATSNSFDASKPTRQDISYAASSRSGFISAAPLTPIRPVAVSHGAAAAFSSDASTYRATNCRSGICNSVVRPPQPASVISAPSFVSQQPSGGHRERPNIEPAGADDDLPCAARRPGDPCASKNLSRWSEWGAVGPCSATCGTGVRQRRRFCAGGGACSGEAMKEEPCQLAVCATASTHHEWAAWSEWSRCSVTCIASQASGFDTMTGGQMMRERKCRGAASAAACRGAAIEVRACGSGQDAGDDALPPCTPQWASWAAWTAWSDCTTTCGTDGWRERQRECLPHGGATRCPPTDARRERRPCYDEGETPKSCPTWGRWTPWSECSRSCGGGKMIRTRECLYGLGDECGSADEALESNTCNPQSCPEWTEWTVWSQCSQSCGDEGSRFRSRECRYEGRPINDCAGAAQDQSACQLEPCPHWAAWSAWSECSASCGHGQQLRTRGCEPRGQGCAGGDREIRFCQLAVCPYYDTWSEWGGCSVTCGRGVCERRRRCHVDDPLPGAVLPTDEELSLSGPIARKGSTSRRGDSFLTAREPPGTSRPILLPDDVDSEAKLLSTAKAASPTRFLVTTEAVMTTTKRPRLRQRTLEVAQSAAAVALRVTRRRRTAPPLKPFEDERVPDSVGGGSSSSCMGPDVERKECDAGPCCAWSSWSDWGVCRTRCSDSGSGGGGGSRTRSRMCMAEDGGFAIAASETGRDFSASAASSSLRNNEPVVAVGANEHYFQRRATTSDLHGLLNERRSNMGVAYARRPKRQLTTLSRYAIQPQPAAYYRTQSALGGGGTYASLPFADVGSSGCECVGSGSEAENCQPAEEDAACVEDASASLATRSNKNNNGRRQQKEQQQETLPDDGTYRVAGFNRDSDTANEKEDHDKRSGGGDRAPRKLMLLDESVPSTRLNGNGAVKRPLRNDICEWSTWAEWTSCGGDEPEDCSGREKRRTAKRKRALRARSRECLRGDDAVPMRGCSCDGENFETETCQLVPTKCDAEAMDNGELPPLPAHQADSLRFDGEEADGNAKMRPTFASSQWNSTSKVHDVPSFTPQGGNANGVEKIDEYAEDRESNCYWSEWSDWEHCSSDAASNKDGGKAPMMANRTRLCVGLKAVLADCQCEGDFVESRKCVPTDVSSISGGLVALNAQVAHRPRLAVRPADPAVDTVVEAEKKLLDSLRSHTAAVFCQWSKWTAWTRCLPLTADCSTSDGERTRSRHCPCGRCEGGGITQETEGCTVTTTKLCRANDHGHNDA